MDLQKSDGRMRLFWSISRWGKHFPEKIKSVTIDCQCQRTKETIEEPWKKKATKFLIEHFNEMYSRNDKTHEEEKSVISENDCKCQALVIEQSIEEVTLELKSHGRGSHCVSSVALLNVILKKVFFLT